MSESWRWKSFSSDMKEQRQIEALRKELDENKDVDCFIEFCEELFNIKLLPFQRKVLEMEFLKYVKEENQSE